MTGTRRLRSQKVPLGMTLASESAENKKSIHPTPKKPERPLPGRKPDTQQDPTKALPRNTRKRTRSQADLDENREHGEEYHPHEPTAVPLTTSPPQQPKQPDPDQNFNNPPDPAGVLGSFKKSDWVSSWVEGSTRAYEDMSGEGSIPQSVYSGEPASRSDSRSANSPSARSGQSGTKQPDYQWKILERALIYMKRDDDIEAAYPKNVAKLVTSIGKTRGFSDLTKESVRADGKLWRLMGSAKEEDVFGFFARTLFPADHSGVVLRHDKQSMRVIYVPKDPRFDGPISGVPVRVSTPSPDMLYGYDHISAVSPEERITLYDWQSGFGNHNNLLFPFLLVETKADEPMWAARNQCLGGASTCVRVMEQFNEKRRESGAGKAQQVDSTTFSVAVNSLVAMLYVTWFDQGKRYFTRLVKGFFLHDFDQFIAFNDHIQNILKWGGGARLDAIRKALTALSNVSPPPIGAEASEVQDEVASGGEQADEDYIASPSPPASVSSRAKLRAVAKSIPPRPCTRSAAKGKGGRNA